MCIIFIHLVLTRTCASTFCFEIHWSSIIFNAGSEKDGCFQQEKEAPQSCTQPGGWKSKSCTQPRGWRRTTGENFPSTGPPSWPGNPKLSISTYSGEYRGCVEYFSLFKLPPLKYSHFLTLLTPRKVRRVFGRLLSFVLNSLPFTLRVLHLQFLQAFPTGPTSGCR